MAQEKIEFPYSDLDAGLADDFTKIGGRVEAFHYLSHGYKQVRWRRRTERSRWLRETSPDADRDAVLTKSVFDGLPQKYGAKQGSKDGSEQGSK